MHIQEFQKIPVHQYPPDQIPVFPGLQIIIQLFAYETAVDLNRLSVRSDPEYDSLTARGNSAFFETLHGDFEGTEFPG